MSNLNGLNMRDILFIKKDDGSKCVFRTNQTSVDSEQITLMDCHGLRGTWFEHVIPFRCGSVVSMTDLRNFANELKSEIKVIMCSGDESHELVSDFNLNLSVNLVEKVIGTSTTTIALIGEDSNDNVVSVNELSVHNGSELDIPIKSGVKYSFEIDSENYYWFGDSGETDAPDPFVCDGDVTMEITIAKREEV